MASGFFVVLALLAPLAIYVGIFSCFAALRRVDLVAFWSGVLGAWIPWTVSTLVIVFSIDFLPSKHQQAGTMAGLFPMLGSVGAVLVSSIVSLFLRPEFDWRWRFRYFAIASSIPAVLVTATILMTFVATKRTKP